MNSLDNRRYFSFDDGKKLYYDQLTYMEATNGLFMGTKDEWIALGGCPDPYLIIKDDDGNVVGEL